MSQLTPHQKEIYNRIKQSEEKILLLTGEGGTGKSFLTKYIIENILVPIVATGTTHKSIKALNTTKQVTTINQYLHATLERKGFTKTINIRRTLKVKDTDYLIVDEASMLQKVLMERINELLNEGKIKKVLLVGDPVQLKLNESIDLSEFPQICLTEQLRQKNTETDLYQRLKALRSLLNKKPDTKLDFKEHKSRSYIATTNYQEFADLYNETQDDKKIIVGTNEETSLYNEAIIKNSSNRDTQYAKGDIIQITSSVFSNDGRVIFNNRDVIKVTKAVEQDDRWVLQADNIEKDFIVFKRPEYKERALNAIITEEEAQENSINSIIEVDKRNRLDDNSTIAHHTFASTVHSMQGTTVTSVFIDIKSIQTNYLTNEETLRLLYVALSRATDRAVVYIGEHRDYSKLGL